MTEQELRQKVVDTANAWKGYKQSNGTHKEIIDTYNSHKPLARGYKVTYTDAWCATYVSAVAIKCGLTDIMFTECSCPQMINLYNKAGRFVEDDAYTPKLGDIVMYDWDDGNAAAENKGNPDHTGLVIAINGSSMTIIEGNYSYAVKTRKLSVNGKYIRGYCCPDYASKADSKPASKPADTKATYTVQASGQFDSQASAEKALEYIEGMGFKGTISKMETAPKEIAAGDTVRMKKGAKFYDGKTPNPVVYDRNHTVYSIKGDRVVISISGIIIGAVHKNDLTLV